MKQNKIYEYDVALSFAGENREYVEEVAIFLKDFGVKVFYDNFKQDEIWGKNLFEYLQDIYQNKAKYTIVFISNQYKNKKWTRHEYRSAQVRALNEIEQEYILPVKFDDTELPGLNENLAYVSAKNKTPKEIADFFINKIGLIFNQRWWGNWERDSIVLSNTGSLFIKDVKQNGFIFDLMVQNGAYLGILEDEYAKFTSKNEAVFEEDENKIKFMKTKEGIQIDSINCQNLCGMGAYFDGIYEFQKDIFTFYDDIIDDFVLSKIYALITKDEKLDLENYNSKSKWDDFLKCFGYDTHIDNLDNFKATIIETYAPGFYSDYAAILMINDNKEIWGAFSDVDKIYYFTTEQRYKNKIPKTIENWAIRFKTSNIIYLD
ncbi:TIR domain-containing protein [Campylobacter concisus]|uniref:toll/interleukin-1 receptor domain-containing protein n=2 Tax=Campylobacter concisus TaxID=199 RepID=UPI0015E1A775|nr:TIR domain-containing protein [Campylobacter concisus]MBE9870580.1 TIR domain-containing protein [Campylobacter concisus]